MKTAKSFASLSKVHKELDHLFDSHQRRLLSGEIDLALAALSKFRNELERHIDFEERRLLPFYADEGTETVGQNLKIFQAEHRKLRHDIASLTQRAEQLLTSADLPGANLALLSDEVEFKKLFHHHVNREQKVLFPHLEERAAEEERDPWPTRE
jgi:hemerythrin-like domain-containing protein